METLIVHDMETNKSKRIINSAPSLHGSDELHFGVNDLAYGVISHFKFHWHMEYEMIYLLDHHLDFYVDGKTYHLTPGQILFLDSNSVHGPVEQYAVYGHYISFHFGSNFLFPDTNSYIYNQYFLPFVSGEKTFTKHIKGCCSYEKEIIHFAEKLRMLSSNITENAFSIQLCLLHIFEIMLREDAFDTCSHTADKKDLIKSAMYYIEQNYASDITVESIAHFLHISPTHFRRLFKASTGISPKEYILDMRINRAINEMRLSPYGKLTTIAIKSGFSEQNYFARVFKSKMGISPSSYQKKLQV